MRRLPFIYALVVLANLAVPTLAADLTKIDRTIAKEPVYRNKPKYCLLVFGSDTQTHVWLVIDGRVLYVDRNGNGDLTQKEKQVAADWRSIVYSAGDITEAGRGTKHTGLLVTQKGGGMVVSIMTEGKCRQRSGSVAFAGRSSDAPIIHFNGPLSVRFTSAVADTHRDRVEAALAEIGAKGRLKLGKDIPLPSARRQNRTVTLAGVVGTPGLGKGTFAAYKAREVLGQPNERIAVQVAFLPQDASAKRIRVQGFLQPDS